MAAVQVTTAAPGVARIDFALGYHLIGTKDALLSAGFALAEWFADGSQRDKRGRARRTVRGEHDGKRFRCVREARKGTYQVTMYYVGAERDAREEAFYARAAERSHGEAAKVIEAQRLNDLPATSAAYRARMATTGENIAREVRGLARRGCGGYRYDDDAMEAIEDALAELAAALDVGRIVYSEREREKIVTAARAKTAKADAALQAFLATATASAKP